MEERSGCLIAVIYLVIIVFLTIGEIKSIIKAVKCNWEPIGKAEVFYTCGACTGLGGIIGWFNIEDK